METQETISGWGRETFGHGPRELGMMTARANVEAAELISVLHHPDIEGWREKVASEVADVWIVLCQGMDGEGIPQEATTPSQKWIDSAEEEEKPILFHGVAVSRLLLMLFDSDRSDQRLIANIARRINTRLTVMCKMIGSDLQREVDAKMSINRARKWQRLANGRNQHV
jgi:hypothetical protein